MNKLRRLLMAIALVATLSGLFLQGSGSLANTASSWHASSASVVGQLARSGAPRPLPPCPSPGVYDC
jgi:hypothetical protein